MGISKTGVPGAAIPAVAIMAEAFPQETKLSVGAMLPLLLVGDVFAIAYYRRHAQWRRLVELLPYVAAGMAPGYFVLRLIPGDGLRVLLGLIILGLLTLHLASQRFGRGPAAHRWPTVAATGVLAGFGTTVGNAAGPVMSIYLVNQKLDKHEFLGAAAWFFFLVNLSKIPLFATLGMIEAKTLRFDAALLPVVVIGALVGAATLKRIPQAAFNWLVLALAGVAGLHLVFS